MFDLERLEFSQIKDAYPDRYDKVSLAAASIVKEDGPQFVVERSDSNNAHICELVKAMSHPWGHCYCDGYKMHEGPCSHLCALWRADQAGLIDIPTARPEAISVEVHDDQTELAQHQAEPEHRPVADGGEL